jgi:RNA polymerase primary sigma factor
MITGKPRQPGAADDALLRALLAGHAGAWERFVLRCQADIFTACQLAVPDAEVNDAFQGALVALRANDFELLRAFKFRPRFTLASYLRVVMRDLLAQRVARLLTENQTRGWRAFEHFFKRDIEHKIAETFRDAAGTGRDEDVYHDIVAELVKDNYRRIMAYDGTGPFGGFVLRVVRNLCIDIQRRDLPRRRLPAQIARLSAGEQEVFRQLYWENCPREQLAGALRAQGVVLETPEAIATAVAAIQEALPRSYRTGEEAGRPREVPLPGPGESHEGQRELADDRLTPEDETIARQDEVQHEQHLQALRTAIPQLPPDVRLYLQHVTAREPEPKAAEIARLMGRPVEDIYRLKQQAWRQLRQILLGNDPEKKSEAVRLTSPGGVRSGGHVQ